MAELFRLVGGLILAAAWNRVQQIAKNKNLLKLVPILGVLALLALAGYMYSLGNSIDALLKKGCKGINLNGLWLPPGVMWVSCP